MKNQNAISRRAVIKNSILGIITVSIPNILYSKGIYPIHNSDSIGDIFYRYPSIDDELVLEVVTVSHFNLDRVKVLVNKRPEIARATWDWAFGDWETALGAASHVGRRDIATFLMSKGARPDIFTYSMLGNYNAVKAMIEETPGIESIEGPHGISLLEHAKAGIRSADITETQKNESNKLISYLEGLGTSDSKPVDIKMASEEQEKYVGDYMFGNSGDAGVTIKLTSRKTLSLGKLGKSGGDLHQKSPNVFTYNGTTSVEIKFTTEGDKVVSMTIIEPDLTLRAIKV